MYGIEVLQLQSADNS